MFYSTILKAVEISDTFVSKKGQSKKIFESFSNQVMKSFTEDKDSFNEKKKNRRKRMGKKIILLIPTARILTRKKDEANKESKGQKSLED